MKKLAILAASAAVAVSAAVPSTAGAVNGTQAAQQANYAAWNNCPRSGLNYKCLAYDSAIFNGLGSGRWSGQIQVWECWKIDPFCRTRASARRYGQRYLRINADGSWTFTSGWIGDN